MPGISKVAIFEGKRIRRVWDGEKELWFFSVVDVMAVLTDSTNPRKYWNKLAERLRQEGSESVTKCHQLKMRASDGKYYQTDAADTEVMLRIIQSIPSPNAEPFKLWLARVGKVAREGGIVAGNARREIELKTGKRVITKRNAKALGLIRSRKINS